MIIFSPLLIKSCFLTSASLTRVSVLSMSSEDLCDVLFVCQKVSSQHLKSCAGNPLCTLDKVSSEADEHPVDKSL